MHGGLDVRGSAGNSPVVVSVPHAGRAYSDALQGLLAVSVDRLQALEDRYADRLAGEAGRAGHLVVVAGTPRLVIDLNRAEDDLDPAWVAGIAPAARVSARARHGLGLIPTRLGGLPAIWRAPITAADLAARIAQVHRPFHVQLATALRAARQSFGTAVLIDLHSMPPGAGADVVIGDAHGSAAGSWVTATAQALCQRQGLTVAINRPYAGAHILGRHAAPGRGIHGVQIEFDRRLYLDARLDAPGPGLPPIAALVAKLADQLGAQIGVPRLAAE